MTLCTREADERVATLTPLRGTALYIASVLGPGILTLPALAAATAGPSFLLALLVLLALSWPLASTFAELGRRLGSGGVAGYVAEAFGDTAGRVVTTLFYLGVPPGLAALGLFGGGYVQNATGGDHTAALVASAAVVMTWVSNSRGLRASASAQLVLTGALLLLIAAAVVVSVPAVEFDHFATPAPHGWTALIPASFLLVWVLTGWEASANLASSLPPAATRRIVIVAVAVVAAAFLSLSIVLVGVLGPTDLGKAPVASMLAVSIGPAAAGVVIAMAVALTLGNMNAYVASLGVVGEAIPAVRRLRGGPLGIPVVIALASVAATAPLEHAETVLVGITAACQVPVLALGMAAGVRLLPPGAARRGAIVAATATAGLLATAGPYLIAPLLLVAAALLAGTRPLSTSRRPARSRSGNSWCR